MIMELQLVNVATGIGLQSPLCTGSGSTRMLTDRQRRLDDDRDLAAD